jgi:hypothetical protein
MKKAEFLAKVAQCKADNEDWAQNNQPKGWLNQEIELKTPKETHHVARRLHNVSY